MKTMVIAGCMMCTIMVSSVLAEDNTAYVFRATSDMARLDFRMITEMQDQTWAIFLITPHQDKSEEDKKTPNERGPFASPDLSIPITGRWSAIRIIQGQLDSEVGDYKWVEPSVRTGRETGVARARVFYDPFRYGGQVLCRFNASAAQMDVFSKVFLIPDGWEKPLQDAHDAYKKLGASWDKLTKEEIRELIDSNNAVTSVLSFKHALHHRQIDAQVVESVVSQSADIKKSILVHIALSAPPNDSAGSDGIAKIVEHASDVKVIEELAIGITSVLAFSTEAHTIERATQQLLRLKERMVEMNISIDGNDTLIAAFANVGLNSEK